MLSGSERDGSSTICRPAHGVLYSFIIATPWPACWLSTRLIIVDDDSDALRSGGCFLCFYALTVSDKSTHNCITWHCPPACLTYIIHLELCGSYPYPRVYPTRPVSARTGRARVYDVHGYGYTRFYPYGMYKVKSVNT